MMTRICRILGHYRRFFGGVDLSSSVFSCNVLRRLRFPPSLGALSIVLTVGSPQPTAASIPPMMPNRKSPRRLIGELFDMQNTQNDEDYLAENEPVSKASRTVTLGEEGDLPLKARERTAGDNRRGSSSIPHRANDKHGNDPCEATTEKNVKRIL
jgi:hypothetical protein